MLIMLLVIMLLFSVIRFSIRLAWGMTKLLFGLGLFILCPFLFILAIVTLGAHLLLPLLILGLLFGFGFCRH